MPTANLKKGDLTPPPPNEEKFQFFKFRDQKKKKCPLNPPPPPPLSDFSACAIFKFFGSKIFWARF